MRDALTAHDRQVLIRAVGAAFANAGALDWRPYWRELSDLGRHVLLRRDADAILEYALRLWADAAGKTGARIVRHLTLAALDDNTRKRAADAIARAQIEHKRGEPVRETREIAV